MGNLKNSNEFKIERVACSWRERSGRRQTRRGDWLGADSELALTRADAAAAFVSHRCSRSCPRTHSLPIHTPIVTFSRPGQRVATSPQLSSLRFGSGSGSWLQLRTLLIRTSARRPSLVATLFAWCRFQLLLTTPKSQSSPLRLLHISFAPCQPWNTRLSHVATTVPLPAA
ncbi:hypothetical protein BKA80DRAFT_106143 [Phyllosticta citrichinensis]